MIHHPVGRLLPLVCVAFLLSVGLALCLAVPGSAVAPARAATLTVTSPADAGPGSLRQAIIDAGPGDSVTFALSYPATITLITGEIVISKPLTIAGPGPDLLAISGNGSSRVFRVDDPEGHRQIAVNVSGLTIRDGAAASGGGMWSDEVLELSDVAFLDNVVSGGEDDFGQGGGLYTYVSTPVLTDVFFGNNSAIEGGGFCGKGTLTGVTFRHNQATSGGGMWGGGTLTDVIFEDNQAANWGGGFYAYHYTGATLKNVTFQRNQASFGGGMASYYYGQCDLTDVAFWGNSADTGGGMANVRMIVSLANVVFCGNVADNGAGAYNRDSSMTALQVTFQGNRAEQGGGMHNEDSSLTLQNSIVWGNEAGYRSQIYNQGSTPVIAYSDVEGSGGSGVQWDLRLGFDGGGNLDDDPLFVTPADPANAPTTTGNLALRPGSPAINAGDNGLLPPGLTADLDGNPRIALGIVDMGAYEVQSLASVYLPVVVGGAQP